MRARDHYALVPKIYFRGFLVAAYVSQEGVRSGSLRLQFPNHPALEPHVGSRLVQVGLGLTVPGYHPLVSPVQSAPNLVLGVCPKVQQILG